jgi:hypothetical protein
MRSASGRLRTERKVRIARKQPALIRRGNPRLHSVRGDGTRPERNCERADREPRPERRRIHTQAESCLQCSGIGMLRQ